MCLIILKSLAKGQSVSIKRTDEVHPKGTSAQDQGITLTPQDKENLKQIVDMFQGQYSREFVKQVYLSEGKNSEKTLDRFLNQNLPEQSKIVVEVNQQPTQIDTNKSVHSKQKENLQKYVMEEYRDILFPKKESKFARQAQIDH